jgi:hypothetical protein
MKPTDPQGPPPPKPSDDDQRPEPGAGRRPGGHGSYKLGGEPAIGHRWDEAPQPPPPAPMTRFDDGVPHRHHEPGEEDLLHNVDVEHEHRDVHFTAVIGAAITLAMIVVVSQVLMWGLFKYFENEAAASDPQVSPLAAPPADMPNNTRESPFFNPNVGGPPLMTNEPAALARQRAEEQKRLHGYGWVNQTSGVAFIPIDEAKKLLRERGLPVREGEAVAPTLGTRLPARGESSSGRAITILPAEGAVATPEAAPAPAHGEKPHGETPAAKPKGPGGH